MAALSDTNPTLLDLAKRTDPDGTIADVVEMLGQTNEILLDMSWVEGNLATGHRTTARTGLPVPTWRKMYGGVQPTKSKTAQVTDNTGMLEAYAEVDVALANLNGNSAAWRLSEEKGHIEGIGQQLASTLMYGNEGTQPEAFTGIMPRFNDLSAANAENIIDAGGTGSDNASILLACWGPSTGHGIVPKGSQAGLQITDKGQVTIEDVDGSGGRMEAYRTHYRQDAGLTIRDWRYFVRIANIDRSLLTADLTTGANLCDLMFEAIERIPNIGMGRCAFYMDRGIRTKVRQQSSNGVKNSSLTIENVGGVPRMDFQALPMRRVDAMSANEARVV